MPFIQIPNIGSSKADKNLEINSAVDSYTLVLTDADSKMISIDKATAVNLTIPPESSVYFEIGAQINAFQKGAGQITVVPGSGVTLRSADDMLKTRAQYSAIGLLKIASDEWLVYGDLDE